jgi:DNA polymerase V
LIFVQILKKQEKIMGLGGCGYVEQVFRCFQHNFYKLPLYRQTISAGFPSPADDELEEKLDLHQMLVKHPAATFFLKVSGHSMKNAGIHDGDILVVDRSVAPSHGKVVIASLNGELTVKRLWIEGKRVRLAAENDAYPSIDITEEADLRIWGVVTSAIHQL